MWLYVKCQLQAKSSGFVTNSLENLYSNFLFIHYEAQVTVYIAKFSRQAEIYVAKCLKCGAFCSVIQSKLHPVLR